MKEIKYNRSKALEYTKNWALKRNPNYYDFSKIGGDCTNFASQCIYYANNVMNFTPITGWYYISAYDRTASWTSVEYFYKFITTNKSVGPFGNIATINEIQPADFIQLKSDKRYHHTLIIEDITDSNVLVSSHSNDNYKNPLSSYEYDEIRFIHIAGIRIQ